MLDFKHFKPRNILLSTETSKHNFLFKSKILSTKIFKNMLLHRLPELIRASKVVARTYSENNRYFNTIAALNETIGSAITLHLSFLWPTGITCVIGLLQSMKVVRRTFGYTVK